MSAYVRPTRSGPVHRKVITIVLAANLFFWVYFWLDFGFRTQPYKPRPPVLDEPVPHFVFWGKALPWQKEMLVRSLQLAQWIQAPSFFVARPYVWVVNKNPQLWDEIFLGVSPGGYLLLIVMVLSFGQWYLVGIALRWLLGRWMPATQVPTQ